jgi:excisionase family DNA binding protein
MATTTKRNALKRGALPTVSVPPDRLTFGVIELANALGVCTGFVRLEISRGRLRAIKRGGRVLIPRLSVETYLSSDTAA